MILDAYMPSYGWHERHCSDVDAPPARVLAAVREVTPREVPLMVVLMGLRTLPSRLLPGPSPAHARTHLDHPILSGAERAGFVELSASADELVLGVVGRFWQLSGGIRPVAADAFAAFDEPGWLKGAVNFHAAERPDGGTRLCTETRVVATDDRARGNFAPYWRLVQPGSALIRLVWLRAIRRRAER